MQTKPRRQFLVDLAGAGTALALAGAGRRAEGKESKEEEVSPTEDLMREHGVMRRIAGVYREVMVRVEKTREIPAEPVAHAAKIIRTFIEDYHERDEEEFIFPRFQRAGLMTDLVAVLLQQHQAGRKLTATIERLATPAALAVASNRAEMAEAMRRFVGMYEPHAAREDTVLFPAFARLLSPKELHRLMETFEEKEKSLPQGDFEKMVADVAAIEKVFGLDDLARFTPVAPAGP